MSEQIETAEALDALPVGSVVCDRDGDEWRRGQDGLWRTAETVSFTARHIFRKRSPLTLVSRPEAPVQPDPALEVAASLDREDRFWRDRPVEP